jgi:hypothetical protein
MTQNRQTIVILCEDLQQYVFAKSFLQKRGFQGNFEPRICPAGKQSGEQYVRDRYAAEVKAYRSKKNHLKIFLIVVIDADTGTVPNRIAQLEQALDEKTFPRRQSDDKIAIFVPKRNIETCIHYAMGATVNEELTYPKFPKDEGACKPFVEALANQCQQAGLANDAPPSMQIACTELQRILPPS